MIFRTLRICIFSFYAFLFFVLFPDTKLPEYVAKDLFGVDLADDFADVEDGFADVLGEEIGWELFGFNVRRELRFFVVKNDCLIKIRCKLYTHKCYYSKFVISANCKK